MLVGWSLAVPELVYFADHTGSEHVGGYVLVDGFLWNKPNAEFATGIRDGCCR